MNQGRRIEKNVPELSRHAVTTHVHKRSHGVNFSATIPDEMYAAGFKRDARNFLADKESQVIGWRNRHAKSLPGTNAQHNGIVCENSSFVIPAVAKHNRRLNAGTQGGKRCSMRP